LNSPLSVLKVGPNPPTHEGIKKRVAGATRNALYIDSLSSTTQRHKLPLPTSVGKAKAKKLGKDEDVVHYDH